MVEQQKRRLEGAISEMIEDMYRSHLRRMQVSSGVPLPPPFFMPTSFQQVRHASLRRHLL